MYQLNGDLTHHISGGNWNINSMIGFGIACLGIGLIVSFALPILIGDPISSIIVGCMLLVMATITCIEDSL